MELASADFKNRRHWMVFKTVLGSLSLALFLWVCLGELLLLPRSFTSEVEAYFEWDSINGFRTFRVKDLSDRAVGGPVWRYLVAAQIKPRLDSYLRQPGWERIDGHLSVTVAKFIPVAYPNALGSDGDVLYDPDETDLMHAADKGDLDEVRKLLLRGVDVNARDQRQQTALIHAGLRGKSSPVLIRELLAAGANVNASDRIGRTALFWAAQGPDLNSAVQSQRLAIIQQLLASHANVNAKDKTGNTPLMTASAYADVDTVRALLVAGADVVARNNEGQTALSIAEAKSRTEIVELLKRNPSSPGWCAGAAPSRSPGRHLTRCVFCLEQHGKFVPRT